jgi:hypothetical protein
MRKPSLYFRGHKTAPSMARMELDRSSIQPLGPSNPGLQPGRTTAGTTTDYPSAAREILAGLFHTATPEHVIFTQNATDSLNLLVHGFAQKQGEPFHAITTELEHNSVLRPLTALRTVGRSRSRSCRSGASRPEPMLTKMRSPSMSRSLQRTAGRSVGSTGRRMSSNLHQRPCVALAEPDRAVRILV